MEPPPTSPRGGSIAIYSPPVREGPGVGLWGRVCWGGSVGEGLLGVFYSTTNFFPPLT